MSSSPDLSPFVGRLTLLLGALWFLETLGHAYVVIVTSAGIQSWRLSFYYPPHPVLSFLFHGSPVGFVLISTLALLFVLTGITLLLRVSLAPRALRVLLLSTSLLLLIGSVLYGIDETVNSFTFQNWRLDSFLPLLSGVLISLLLFSVARFIPAILPTARRSATAA